MKQKTFNLYLKHPHDWAEMTYKDALVYRIKSAREAMAFYKLESERHISGDPEKYKLYADKFRRSNDAKEFNQNLLEEVL